MVLGKLPVPGRPTIWITVEQGPTALLKEIVLLASQPYVTGYWLGI